MTAVNPRVPAAIAAIAAAAALAACSDDGVAALETTRDRVCKCIDAPCVNAAMDALEDRPTRHQRRAEGVAREITDCIARIYRDSDARAVDDEPAADDATDGDDSRGDPGAPAPEGPGAS